MAGSDEDGDAAGTDAVRAADRPAEPFVRRPTFTPLGSEYAAAEEAVRPKTREFVRVGTDANLVEYVPSEFVPRGTGRSASRARRGRRGTRMLPGLSALVLAGITVVLFIIGIELALVDNFVFSIAVAWAAVGFSVLGFVLGGAAAILRRGRILGICAMVLCLAANPILLTKILDWAGGLAG